MGKRQVLSDESLNSHGFVVLNSGVDWGRFLKNPVLLDEHRSWDVPIGRVADIRLEGGRWTGELVFADTVRGREAKGLYDGGFYSAVSIGGSARKVQRDEGLFAVGFKVFEVPLVAVPANENAVSYSVKDGLGVVFDERDGGVCVGLELLSADECLLINNFLDMSGVDNGSGSVNGTNETNGTVGTGGAAGTVGTDNLGAAAGAAETGGIAGGAGNDGKPAVSDGEPAWVKRFLAALGVKEKGTIGTKETPETEDGRADPAPAGTNEVLGVSGDARVFDGKKFFEKVKDMRVESALKWLGSDEGRYKMGEVVRLSNRAAHDAQVVAHPDNAGAVRGLMEFADCLRNDVVAMRFLDGMRFDVNGGRSESVPAMAERLSSGAGVADFVENTPDLAKAVWLGLFLQQLLPENSWAARTQKASGVDRAGMIWVESAINPAVYMGRRAPLSVPDYFYDDVARGLTTKVFSIQPVSWQPSNTDILGYNDQGTGMAEMVRLIAERIHQYTLQVAAEEAGEVVRMTGGAISAAGWFPGLNPAAAGNISSLSIEDLALLTAKFVNENFLLDMYQGVLVLDARYAAALKLDERVTNIDYKNAGAVKTRFTQFDAWDIFSRSRVIGFDTAASAVVDPEWYLDGKVGEDGSIGEYVPPVIPATTYGAGLAFVPNQIVMAMGNTNVHMVSDPNSYAWKVSSDIRFGAGVLRSDGLGVKVIAPSVVN